MPIIVEPLNEASYQDQQKITRRRGVAERLVNEAQKMASQSGATLHLLAPAGHLEAQALAAKLKIPLDVLPR